MKIKKQRFPQELLAEALWIEWFLKYGVLNSNKVEELLRRFNLKLKKQKTIDNVRLAFGRGLKDTHGSSQLAIKQIAEELDKVCIIARWDF